jgi:hypothetical protein
MTLQELQRQVLQLSVQERWQVVQAVLDSLQQETRENLPGNLSQLRGIAKDPAAIEVDAKEDYVTYLTEKYK